MAAMAGCGSGATETVAAKKATAVAGPLGAFSDCLTRAGLITRYFPADRSASTGEGGDPYPNLMVDKPSTFSIPTEVATVDYVGSHEAAASAIRRFGDSGATAVGPLIIGLNSPNDKGWVADIIGCVTSVYASAPAAPAASTSTTTRAVSTTATAAASLRSCPQNAYITPSIHTSCAFAANIYKSYAAAPATVQGGASTLSVNSPTTGGTYSVTCKLTGHVVNCDGANGIHVSFNQAPTLVLHQPAQEPTPSADTTPSTPACAAGAYNSQGTCLSDPTFRALCTDLYAQWQADGETQDQAIVEYGQLLCDQPY